MEEHFRLQGSTIHPFSFERETETLGPELAASSSSSSSSVDVVFTAVNPKKRDRTTLESDTNSASGLCLTVDDNESSKRQRFGNYSVTEVDRVYERVVLWLAANSDRLPRTLGELEQAIQFINGFKAKIDPECVFHHLVLNGFLRVSETNDHYGYGNFPYVHQPLFSSSLYHQFQYRPLSKNDNLNDQFYSSLTVSVNPYPANFEGSFLIVSPDAGPNSLSGSFKVSQDFVTALNKAVTWLRSSLQLPTTKQGFTTALRKVCISHLKCPAPLIIERLLRRDIVSVSSEGSLLFNTALPQINYHPFLHPPAFYTTERF